MAADDKWYFTKEQLQNTPSRKCGLDADKELSYRQQAANFIQDMGQKLQVSQLCINTAIVYMHRFYMFHSFTHFPWNTIAAAAFFLAAKVEEQPRKLEHVIRIANHCLHREQPVVFDAKSEQYAAQSQDLVFNENVLLQTLGFDVAIDHPHTHVVRCCHLVRDFCALMHAKSLENVNSLKSSALKVNDCISASIDLSKTSYFMASNSLHLTTMCLQYKPTVVACFCIHLASKWSNWQIPKSNEGKDWYYYVDKTVTAELLEQLTSEFLKIFDKCPSRLKRKITSISNHNSHNNIDQLHAAATSVGSPFDPDSRKYHSLDTSKDCGGSGLTFHRSHHDSKQALLATPETSDPHKKPPRTHDQQQRADYREYREKKERERLEREKVAASSSSQHHKTSASASGSGSGSGGGVAGSSSSSSLPVGGSKHLPPSGSSNKAHHRPPPAGIDPTKMKMHHRPNDALHREHQAKEGAAPRDMTNGRGEGPHRDRRADYISQQQAQIQQRTDATKLDLLSDIKVEVTTAAPAAVSRQKVPDTKQPPKYDPSRHRRDLDPKYAQQKVPPPRDSVCSVSAVNDKQKPPSATLNPLSSTGSVAAASNSVQDNKNFLNKQINSTSQRHKSPFTEIKPSAPASNTINAPQQQLQHPKPDSRNGSLETKATWMPPQNIPQEQPAPMDKIDEALLSTKKSSLFSPEKTPPQQQQQQQQQKKWNTRTPPNSSSTRRTTETPQLPAAAVPPPISPFGSPPPIQSHPKLQTPTSLRRSRTSSSGSEPELRPVVKKLDQISGFENIIRDSKMGIKLPKVPDIIQPICDRPPPPTLEKPVEAAFIAKELKPPEIIKPFCGTDPALINGIETDPAVISTLLKEAVNPTSIPEDGGVAATEFTEKYTTKSEHHHKSEKKKKKDKHKHKDKDKGREEKKKKHKDKDKERRKDKMENEEVPLKITISKKNVEPVITESSPIVATTGLKVKISRDKIKADSITSEALPPPPQPVMMGAPSTLKIKISKDQIQYNSVVDHQISNNGSTSTSTRKRDRDKMATVAPPGAGIPPTKIMKMNYGGGRDSRQNGKNYYTKVSYNNLNQNQNQNQNIMPPPNPRGRFINNMAPMVQPPPMFQHQQQNAAPQYFVHNYMQPHGYMFAAPDQMYHQYYQGYQMYPTHDMYMQPPPTIPATTSAEGPPPLPDGPPPDAPPPPPPE